MKYITSFAALLSALFFSGCASNVASVPTELRNAVVPGKSGTVLCSIGGGFSSQSLCFRAVATTAEGWLSYGYDGFYRTSYDFKEEKTRGGIVFAQLPPGDYELIDVSFFVNRAQFGSTTYKSNKKFSIPFKIIEGEVTYLGEFIAQVIMGKTIIGLPRDAGGYFVVTDRFDRDSALLKAKDPGAEKMSFKKMVINPSAVSLPAFQSKILK